jgi:hypothetical protein
MCHGAGEEPAGAAGGIEENFAGVWVDTVGHEGLVTARGV